METNYRYTIWYIVGNASYNVEGKKSQEPENLTLFYFGANSSVYNFVGVSRNICYTECGLLVQDRAGIALGSISTPKIERKKSWQK